MKKITTTLLFIAVFGFGAIGLQGQTVVKKASVAPVVGGEIDAVWDEATSNDILKPHGGTDVVSLGDAGETWWKALWTDDGIYVLVNVSDNNFLPH